MDILKKDIFRFEYQQGDDSGDDGIPYHHPVNDDDDDVGVVQTPTE